MSDRDDSVMAILYDRLYEICSFTPVPKDNEPVEVTEAQTFIHFSQYEVINPDDFRGALTPTTRTQRPAENDPDFPKLMEAYNRQLQAAQEFSQMTDVIPNPQIRWTPRTSGLSGTYFNFILGANSNSEVDPKAKALYDKALKVLKKESQVTEINPDTGETTTITQVADRPEYTKVIRLRDTYALALKAYREAAAKYTGDIEMWNVVYPPLQATVDAAKNALDTAGNAVYLEAEQTIKLTLNDLGKAALVNARESLTQFRMKGVDGSDWQLSTASPANWTELRTDQLQKIEITEKDITTTKNSYYKSGGGGGSFAPGLWRVWRGGGDVSSSETGIEESMQSEVFTLTAHIGTVRINRPWMNTSLFQMPNWYAKGVKKNEYSDGTFKGGPTKILPLIPTAFMFARDVKLEVTLNNTTNSLVEKAVKGNARIGWGFLGGNVKYSHGSSQGKATVDYKNGVLTFPGLHILAWVSQIVPPCPPLDGSDIN